MPIVHAICESEKVLRKVGLEVEFPYIATSVAAISCKSGLREVMLHVETVFW